MHAHGYIAFFQIILMAISFLLLLASLGTDISSRSLHMSYLTIALLLLSFSVATSLIVSSFDSGSGLLNILLMYWPSILVVLFLILPIKKSLSIKP